MYKFFLAALALLLAGCVNSGTQVDPNIVATFKTGVTTKSEIIAALGTPNTQVDMGDGTTMISYAHSHAAATAATYIPVAGAFVGGATGNSEMEMFMFDKSGVLTKVQQMHSQFGQNS